MTIAAQNGRDAAVDNRDLSRGLERHRQPGEEGATSTNVVSGTWPGTFERVQTSGVDATANSLYGNSLIGTTQACGAIGDDDNWIRDYGAPVSANGSNPYGTSVAYAASIDRYMIL